ncbi:MAG: diaminopimelate decarboxylase [Clostridia bacterium]|nr:diaminopimelate decarboxylase [Clostridia bacterium]
MLKDRKFICENVSVNGEGHLCFSGVDVTTLAKRYGTPLYIMDESRIRDRCRIYRETLKKTFDGQAFAAYASKAASFKELYRIMASENMYIDVVSSGEIYTAAAAGFPMRNAFFHSNNKTDEDVRFAIENGVGYFVADNAEELKAIEREAEKAGIVQNVLLRITPGIDPHTFAAVTTGKVDSKFGSAIQTGQAKEITELALTKKHITLSGYHCHVGSQVFSVDVYTKTAEIMLNFIANIKSSLGFSAQILNLGGGFGVRYLPTDPEVDIEKNIIILSEKIKTSCAALGLKVPTIILEPGRSIVADAGMTVYTVGTVKKIPDFVNYVSVDGGMTDNVRYAMYKANYTLLTANKMNEALTMKANIAGRCCESGDVIQEHVPVPASIKRGDIIACLTTGAYNYSMASNYNRLPRPPIVMINNGESRIAVNRETFSDICALDV